MTQVTKTNVQQDVHFHSHVNGVRHDSHRHIIAINIKTEKNNMIINRMKNEKQIAQCLNSSKIQ